jgi:hypothetical protein
MIGNLIEVSSRGPVNNKLFHSIPFHKYSAVFIPSTRFSKFIRSVSSNEKADFGKLVVFDIPYIGDLLWKINVKIKLPSLKNLKTTAINAATEQGLIFQGPNFSWIEDLGSHIFEYVELLIDGNSIARYSNDYSSIHYNYSNITQFDYLSKMIKSTSTELDQCILYIPLCFWFNKEIHNSIPLFELKETRVQIRIKLRTINEIIKSDTLIDGRNNSPQYNPLTASYLPPTNTQIDNSGRMLGFTGSYYFGSYSDQLLENETIYGHLGTVNTFRGEFLEGIENGRESDYHIDDCSLICTCINIGNEEKTMIRQKEYVRPIHQIQELQYTNISTTNRTNVRLEFSNPITNLYWFFRHPNAITYYNNYKNISRRIISPITNIPIYPTNYSPENNNPNHQYQILRLPGFFTENAEWLSSASIKFGNREREENREGSIYRQIMSSSVRKYNLYTKYLYRYHFGKRLISGLSNYTTALNTDRMKNMFMEFDFNIANETTNMYILAETINIIHIVGGKTTLLFNN